MLQESNGPGRTSRKRIKCCLRLAAAAGVVLFSLARMPLYAQQGAAKTPDAAEKPPAAPAIPAEKVTSIRRLLELTGARQNAVDFGKQLGDYMKTMLLKNLPPGEQSEQIGNALVAKLTARLDSDELIVRLIPVYDEAFSQDDLKGIIAFYESSYGRKLLEATPKVMERANDVSEQWVNEMLPGIVNQMMEQFPILRQPDAAEPASRPEHK